MLSTGETLNTWVRTKLLTKAGKEVLARTAFNAVLAAVALSMTIYRWVTSGYLGYTAFVDPAQYDWNGTRQ